MSLLWRFISSDCYSTLEEEQFRNTPSPTITLLLNRSALYRKLFLVESCALFSPTNPLLSNKQHPLPPVRGLQKTALA
jgi:hypothetical protein